MVFTTLLRVIGVEEYMWRLLLVFVEGVAVRSQAPAVATTRAASSPRGGGDGVSGDAEAKVIPVSSFEISLNFCIFLYWNFILVVGVSGDAEVKVV
jgi:hypothetical protein